MYQYTYRHSVRALTVVLMMFAPIAGAEDQAVQPATHLAASPAGTGTVVRFSQLPTEIGDRVNQRVGMELNLRTVIKQAGQVAHDSTTSMRRRQERNVKVLSVVDGRALRAQVAYPLSRSLSPENENPRDEFPQAVERKEYVITRQGERLLVTDIEGAIPPREEYDIVVSSMSTFGESNPLTEYLLKQELRVGDRLQVPTHLANQMMGFDSLGEVQKFELFLREVKQVDGKNCAVFVAEILAAGTPENPLKVQASGNVIIELATCRTLEATLSGPISFSSNEQQTEFSASGEVLLAIRSHYASRN